MAIISTTRASYQRHSSGGHKPPKEIPAAVTKTQEHYLLQAKEAIDLALRTKNRHTVGRAITDMARIAQLLINRLD